MAPSLTNLSQPSTYRSLGTLSVAEAQGSEVTLFKVTLFATLATAKPLDLVVVTQRRTPSAFSYRSIGQPPTNAFSYLDLSSCRKCCRAPCRALTPSLSPQISLTSKMANTLCIRRCAFMHSTSQASRAMVDHNSICGSQQKNGVDTKLCRLCVERLVCNSARQIR